MKTTASLLPTVWRQIGWERERGGIRGERGGAAAVLVLERRESTGEASRWERRERSRIDGEAVGRSGMGEGPTRPGISVLS